MVSPSAHFSLLALKPPCQVIADASLCMDISVRWAPAQKIPAFQDVFFLTL